MTRSGSARRVTVNWGRQVAYATAKSSATTAVAPITVNSAYPSPNPATSNPTAAASCPTPRVVTVTGRRVRSGGRRSRGRRYRHQVEDLAQDVGRVDAADLGVGGRQEPVREHRPDVRLQILGNHVEPAV